MRLKSTLILTMILVLALTVPLAHAQEDCGTQYTVVRGDSFARIADKCGLELDDVLAANPEAPAIMYPGDIINLPARVYTPTVTLSPSPAFIGQPVSVTGEGFPANTSVRMGLGLPGTAALVILDTTSDADGMVTGDLPVPTTVQQGITLYVTVQTADTVTSATSDGVVVQRAPLDVGGGENFGTGGPVNVFSSPLAAIPAPVGYNVNGAIFEQVNIYLVDVSTVPTTEATCNIQLTPVQINIDSTVAPLTAGLDATLEQNPTLLGIPNLANPLHGTTLEIDNIVIINSEAIVNLTGEASAINDCNAAQINAQLAATALQYITVDRVSVYVNGTLLTTARK